MRVICVSNMKGGVGKTVTAWSIAAGLADRGFRVLAVDSDPQCNLTFVSGYLSFELENTLNNIYRKESTAEDCIISTEAGYDILPGHLDLNAADLNYSGKPCRESILRRALKSVRDRYDFCVIDTPPHIGLLVQNCLYIDEDTDIIIPMNAELFSIQGLSSYLNTLEQVKVELDDPRFNISGVLITMLENRTAIENAYAENIAEVAEANGIHLFNSRIRKHAKIKYAMLEPRDIFEYCPNVSAANDYNKFIDEYLERIGMKNG